MTEHCMGMSLDMCQDVRIDMRIAIGMQLACATAPFGRLLPEAVVFSTGMSTRAQ